MTEIRARFRIEREAFTLDVDLTIPGRGVTALIGPSGSGKTTVLRLLAGLERTADGFLSVGDALWQDAGHFVPTHRRPLGYVFQEANLAAAGAQAGLFVRWGKATGRNRACPGHQPSLASHG